MKNDIVRKISEVRAANNKLWMRLLDIAIEHAPKKTKAVLRAINLNDRKISHLVERLSK